MAQSKRKPRAKKQTDRVGDQNIIKGNITGGITTQGRNAKVIVHQQGGADIGELNSLFKQLYQHIESRPEDPNIGKEEITQTVQNLEAEVGKGGSGEPDQNGSLDGEP